jgi:hypothetical protein
MYSPVMTRPSALIPGRFGHAWQNKQLDLDSFARCSRGKFLERYVTYSEKTRAYRIVCTIYWYICLSLCLSIYLCIHPSIYLLIYLSTANTPQLKGITGK